MDKVQAFVKFWQNFDVPAYDAYTVPENAVMPYMTYEVVTDSFNNEVAITNSLWYKSTSWANITKKAQEISDYLGMGGSLVKYDDGIIWIKRANPFSQRIQDDKAKRIVLNFSLEFISKD